MGNKNKKVVWILGAGFSKSLGAPLLYEFFTKNSFEDVKARFPEYFNESNQNLLHFSTIAHRLYHYGQNFPEGLFASMDKEIKKHSLTKLWDNAEDFLDKLNAAFMSPNSPLNARLKKALKVIQDHDDELKDIFKASHGDIEEINNNSILDCVYYAAVRLLAAECSGFLKFADTQEEKWEPYINWSKQIESQDTIITFNYDRVVEKLVEIPEVSEFKEEHNINWYIPCPADDIMTAYRNDHVQGEDQEKPLPALILKLHGSVDWRRKTNGKTSLIKKAKKNGKVLEYSALECEDEEISLATPGPTKKKLTEEMGSLWQQAEKNINDADVIVFVGYRFPPSDSNAKSRLLRAIRKNENENLIIWTVLGPDSPIDTKRLGNMLRWVMVPKRKDRRVYVFDLPLFSEDFFAVFIRELLLNPLKLGLPFLPEIDACTSIV